MESVYLREFIARVEKEVKQHERGEYDELKPEEWLTAKAEAEHKEDAAELDGTEKLDFAPESGEENKEEKGQGQRPAVRGDEFESARQLDWLANRMEQSGRKLDAQKTRRRARTLIASQLNEFDGFAR